MSFDLNFSTALIYPLLLILLALGFTLFIYRVTTPAVANWLRRGLAALRTFALALALLLLFEPVLTLGWQRTQKPAVAVLIDQSASMNLADSTRKRADVVRQAFAQPWLQELKKRAAIASFGFSDSLRRMNLDTVPQMHFNGDGSDLGGALLAAKKALADQRLAGAIMFTDGAQNLGENPARVAEQFGVPIITVGIGSARGTRDILLSEVVTNEIAYAETQLPVEISVASLGYAGRRARVRIFAEGVADSTSPQTRPATTTVLEQEVVLPADNTEFTTRFNITPQKIGLNRYVAQIDTLAGELTHANNRRTFYVRVLKNKLKLWILAGAPSADYSFLKRTLAVEPNFQMQDFVQRPEGNFYNNVTAASLVAALNRAGAEKIDGVIMIDFPRRDSDRRLLDALAQQFTKKQTPLFFLNGPGVDLAALWQFRSVLPLAIAPSVIGERLVALQPDLAGLSHPVTRFAETPEDNRRWWEELPPVFCNLINLQPLPGSQVLASITNQSAGRPPGPGRSDMPIILAQKSAERKTVAVFAYGLWRWHLLMQGIGKTPLAHEKLVRNAVRWMVTREDAKLVRLTSNKEIYRGGESVELAAQIYHEDYRPRPGANVRVQLAGPQFSQEVILQDVGDGLYRATLQVLGGGDYQFRGVAEQSGQKIGEDNGRFSVEPFSLEFLNTRLNAPLLQQMAQATGGAYGPPDSLAQFVARLPLTPLTRRENSDFALWGRAPVLLILLVVLGMEWLVRKRQGML
ncbi:MAG: hypothetical protein ALAOOOJD_00622 [bacterium]|nr:hypothetical protein [bacterium]